MSNQAPQETTGSKVPARLRRGFFYSIFVLFIFVFLMMTVGPVGFDLLVVLASGWIGFLRRTIPSISWNWDLVGMAILCTVVIVFVAQWLLRWIVRSISAAHGENWQWRWKWTLCGLATVMVSFLVGMSVGGIVHQTGWIISSPESLYERKGVSTIVDVRELEAAWEMALLDANGDVTKARQMLKNPPNDYYDRGEDAVPLFHRYHFLLIMNEKGELAGKILFPRRASPDSNVRGIYSFEDTDEYFSMDELPELLTKHRDRLLAF